MRLHGGYGRIEKNGKEIQNMLVCDYIVERIDGDYAHLRRTDELEEELKVVARDLLPSEIIEGSMLHYEWMQYTLI